MQEHGKSNRYQLMQMLKKISVGLGAVFFALTGGIACLAWAAYPPADSTAWATWALALFTLALAFFTLVLAVGVPITILLASKENEKASKRFLVEEKNHFYAQLDNIYMDIQKIIIEHPDLANPVGERTSEQEIQYQAFAFIVWNFIESIYDYTEGGKSSDGQLDQVNLLWETWRCIIKYEGTLHAAWFKKSENQKKFKSQFYEYMKGKFAEWEDQQTTAGAVCK